MAGQAPVGSEVAGAFAAFFSGGAGPSHSAITRVFQSADLDDSYIYRPDGKGPNKETRVIEAFCEARKRPATGRKLVDELLVALRLAGLVGQSGTNPSDDETRLRSALARENFSLTDQGELRTESGIDMSTGGRVALDEQLARLQSAQGDPALMIGSTKELIEAVGKFVLEEFGQPARPKASFEEILVLAQERLKIKPTQGDSSNEGFQIIRTIHQSAWQIAKSVNALRNLQGTGHGRTLPTGVSPEMARLVVKEACFIAEYMLTLLDRSFGKR
jgi:hypothetical protein